MKEIRAENVVAETEARWGSACAKCGADLHGLDVVLSLFLGDKGALRCVACAAQGLGRPPEDLVRGALRHLGRLDCWRAGWEHAEARLRREGAWPARGIPADALLAAAAEADPPAERAAAEPCADEYWDAGAASCGDLVLDLRLKLRALGPGRVIRVRAADPGAPGDLPAWCRLTGHALLHSEHPDYWIRAKS